MLRRDFFTAMAAAGTLAALGRGALAARERWRRFEITYRLNLQEQKTPARVWVPVPQDALDFTLPGQQEGPIGFLMYPYAETADGTIDSLDPAGFAYSISVKEIV